MLNKCDEPFSYISLVYFYWMFYFQTLTKYVYARSNIILQISVVKNVNVSLLCFQSLSAQDALATDFKSLTKTLYDLHKAHEPADCKGSPLEQLVIQNFDEEQIWQELELQNDALLTHFEEAVEQAVTDDTITLFEDAEEEEEEDVDNGEIANNLEESAVEDDDDKDKEEKTNQRLKPSASNEDDDFSGEDSDLDFDVDRFEEQNKQKPSAAKSSKSKSNRTPSKLDDRFFKLSEMEAFLDDMDRREGNESVKEDVDYFQNLPSDDDEELCFDKPAALKKQKKVMTFPEPLCMFSFILICCISFMDPRV